MLHSRVLPLLAPLCHLALRVSALPLPDDRFAGVVWTFDNNTWIENIAVRSNGAILATSINRHTLYSVDPFAHTANTVHTFAPTDRLLGITEIEDDVFIISSANESIATNEASPGSSKLWKIDMAAHDQDLAESIDLVANLPKVGSPDGVAALRSCHSGDVLLADSSLGILWRVDTDTGAYSIAVQNDAFNATSSMIPLGLDGIHILDDYLYFTNLGSGILGRIAIDACGTCTGPFEKVANVLGADDFALATDKTAYVVGFNTLYRVSSNGTVDVLAGGFNDTTLEGATTAQFGRTSVDKDVVYIGTSGGLISPVKGQLHGGQILALNVDLFR